MAASADWGGRALKGSVQHEGCRVYVLRSCVWPCVVVMSDQFSKRVGFRSGSKAHKRHVVLVGGLSDGLLPVPYTQQLGQALDAKGWALVQVCTPHTHIAPTLTIVHTSRGLLTLGALVAVCVCVALL